MKLIETVVTETAVRMRYADRPQDATAWIDFQVPLAELVHPAQTSVPLGDPERQLLAEVRLAALRHVRDVIGGETQRLQELRGRTR